MGLRRVIGKQLIRQVKLHKTSQNRRAALELLTKHSSSPDTCLYSARFKPCSEWHSSEARLCSSTSPCILYNWLGASHNHATSLQTIGSQLKKHSICNITLIDKQEVQESLQTFTCEQVNVCYFKALACNVCMVVPGTVGSVSFSTRQSISLNSFHPFYSCFL